ncbi:MAG: hypothetical protein U9P44_01390, partial [archaeon]|nr:hypothetical protein [archaeon]
MTQELDNILKYLSSTDAQLTFLRSIYVPGRIDVADEIILRSEDSSIIRKEIAHAKQACDYDRFRSLAKRYIDYHVSHDFDILLVGIVKEWQDSELADYTIEKMTSKPEKDRKLENPLEYSAEIAQAFGKEDVARDILERLLGLVERDSEYRFPAAQVLEKLGRFDEAIDRYLEAEWVSDAFYLAKEQSPIRSVENAEVGFKNYKQDRGSAQFYVECAELLGKTGQAEKKLVRYAKKVNVVHSPRFYVGIVKSLVLLGQEAVASKFVEKVARHEEQARNSDRYYEFSRSVEMAELYHAVGETDAVRNI